MKKIYTTLSIILTLITGSVLLLSWNGDDQTMSSGGAPGGYAGDPASGSSNCSDGGCHTNWPASPGGSITSNIPVGGYTAGNTYLITASFTSTNGSPYGIKYGFEVAVQDAAGTVNLGTLVPIGTSETQIKTVNNNITGAKYITHKATSNIGTGSRTWTFNWIAPATGSGCATFFGAFNEADNNSNTNADNIYITQTIVCEWFVGVDQTNAVPSITIFPTVSNGTFTIQNTFQNGNYDLSIYNVAGDVVLAKTVSAEVETVNLNVPSGIYFVSMKNGDTNTIRKIVIE